MKFISHRGNINGKTTVENHPDNIKYCIEQGYDVEVDVWRVDNQFALGHDAPVFQVPFSFLQQPQLWLHCKNLDALDTLKDPYYNLNAFFIDKDDCTLTTKNYIWLSPSHKKVQPRSICVMPEDSRWDFDPARFVEFSGICSDNIYYYKNYVTNLRR